MSPFRVLALGVGDAFSARYYSSCLALEAGGAWLLIDCPHPIRRVLHDGARTAGVALDLAQLSGVVLTHLHSDHASGVEAVGFYGKFVLGKQTPLLTHPDVAVDLWDRYLAGSMEWSLPRPGEAPIRRTLDDFFGLIPLVEGEPLQFGPFTLRCRKTIHNIPTIALRVEAAGRTFGYSADTAFDPGLIDWLSSADLIVHEAGGGFLHTKVDELLGLPEPLRHKLRLIHYSDEFDVAASALEPLREGRLYDV